MIGRFNDEDFDGVVLKIPLWWIEMNELMPEFKRFEEALKTAKKSMYLPEHLNNLHELDFINDKKEVVTHKKEQAEIMANENQKKRDAIYNGEMFELEWVEKHKFLDYETVRMEDECFSWDDYMTNKLNIKTAFVNKIKEQINSIGSFKKFALRNCYGLYRDLDNCNEDLININFSFYPTRNCHIGISYSRLMIKSDYKKTKKNIYFRKDNLCQMPDGCFAIDVGGNEDVRFNRLEGFTKSGIYLTKKL